MKKLVLALAISVAGAVAWYSIPGNCAWCPSYRCYMRCSSDCACVTVGGQGGGQCVSVQHVPMLEGIGYRVLP